MQYVSSDEGIAAFIAARLVEDEALIRRNSDGHGLADGFPDYRTYVDGHTDAADAYIEHFGPSRMLRDVEAKRALITFAFQNAAMIDGEWGDGHEAAEIAGGKCADHGAKAAGKALCAIAAVYSDHPGYRPEWEPASP